jgi:hypothetical protein
MIFIRRQSPHACWCLFSLLISFRRLFFFFFDIQIFRKTSEYINIKSRNILFQNNVVPTKNG